MFNLRSITRYHALGKTPIKFTNEEPREVRLEVLAEEEERLDVIYRGKSYFIGHFRGYDVVVFNVDGAFELKASGPVRVWTPELDTLSVVIPEAVSFTRMMQRRQRNPELELMMNKVQATMERRLAQVERDVTLRVSTEQRIALREQFEREAAERAATAKAELDEARANAAAAEPAAAAAS